MANLNANGTEVLRLSKTIKTSDPNFTIVRQRSIRSNGAVMQKSRWFSEGDGGGWSGWSHVIFRSGGKPTGHTRTKGVPTQALVDWHLDRGWVCL